MRFVDHSKFAYNMLVRRDFRRQADTAVRLIRERKDYYYKSSCSSCWGIKSPTTLHTAAMDRLNGLLADLVLDAPPEDIVSPTPEVRISITS